METGKKMNICAGGGGGLKRGQGGAFCKRSVAWAKGRATGVVGPWTKADNRTVLVSFR